MRKETKETTSLQDRLLPPLCDHGAEECADYDSAESCDRYLTATVVVVAFDVNVPLVIIIMNRYRMSITRSMFADNDILRPVIVAPPWIVAKTQ